MNKYIIPVTWHMSGQYEIEAESLEGAINKAFDLELPWDGDYIDDSFEINYDCLKELNNEGDE